MGVVGVQIHVQSIGRLLTCALEMTLMHYIHNSITVMSKCVCIVYSFSEVTFWLLAGLGVAACGLWAGQEGWRD